MSNSHLPSGKYPSPLLEQDFINSACWKFAEYVGENYPEIVEEFNAKLRGIASSNNPTEEQQKS